MSWYDKYCFAQIWVSDALDADSDSFSEKLTALYELEYKRSCLKNFKFKGVPQRRDNILGHIEENLIRLIEDIRDVLVEVFQRWLSAHAILNPSEWAQQRVAEDEDSHIENLIYEYERYMRNNEPTIAWMPDSERALRRAKSLRTILNEVEKHIDQYPSFKNFLEAGVLPDYISMAKEDLQSQGVEEFGRMHGKEFATEEEAEAFIDNMGVSDFDLMDGFFAGDIESFQKSLEQWGVLEGFVKEIYENIVFPLWYNFWRAQGIDETRERVENTFKTIQSVNALDIDSSLSAINIAINESHQNGKMSEYIEQVTGDSDISGLMKSLTDGHHNSDWDKQLVGVGVQIPKTVLDSNKKKKAELDSTGRK